MSTPRQKISLPLMGAHSRTRSQEEPSVGDGEAPIVRAAYLRKLKTMRRRWFVLLGPTPTQPARLAYYENEKKWKVRSAPKREIVLEKCFNINRKQDTRDSRDRWVIALYTLDDCVSILFETEAELNDWLDQLLTLQQGKRGNVEGKKPKPTYEHMWQVTIKSFKPDQGNNQVFPSIMGSHRLCVTNAAVKFFALGAERCHEFPHACLRGCGYNDRVFTIETGRNSPSGAGRLSIECDEKDAMHHLHETVLEAMKASKSKDLYLKQSHNSSRPRSFSLSTSKADSLSPHPPKNIPAYIPSYDLGRSRTISEPPDSAGVPNKSCLRFSTSPSVNSPISPLGSASMISSDGTGSSNSINEHPDTLETPTVMDVLPEESSGEMSIEQITGRDDDYMMMTGPRHYSSSLPHDQPVSPPQHNQFYSESTSHITSPGATSPGNTPVLGPPDPSEYLAMDMLSVGPVETSTPVKSSSSLTLVASPDTITTTATLSSSPLPPSASSVDSPNSFAKTPPVTIRSNTSVLAQVDRQRIPSDDSGYVFMSPDVAVNPDQFRGIIDEPSSRLALEERMGGRRGFGSPRHSSPATQRPPSHTGSKRNSSCLDDNEWIGCDWRLVEDESQPSGDEVYMSVYYPRNTSTTTPTTGTRPLSRVSPASSSSLVSGTPDSRFEDLHLDKVVSRLRDNDPGQPTSRPPRTMTMDSVQKRLSPKYIEIPGVNSKSSSRSNLSPFGRSSPGTASSPSVASQLIGGLFRHRAGSVPTRQPMLERRRHRTQSEGEKDQAGKDS